MSITKTDSPDPVIAGQSLTYTVTVFNAGPSDAVNVIATDTLPAGVAFVSTAGCSGDPNGIPACGLGSIAAGASKQYTITVNVNAGTTGTLDNTVSVISDTPDPAAGNNSTNQQTTVNTLSDLSITKTDSPDPVIAGQSLTYTVTVFNAGPSDAVNLTVTDILPGSVTFVSAVGAGWTCGQAGGVVTCTRPALNIGVSPVITIVVTAPANGGSITNTASVTSASPDPVPGNNSAAQDTTVNASADLSITKSDSPDPINAGGTLTYTLGVNNAGPSDATNLSVTDTLPAGLTFVSASGSGWVCNQAAGIVTCTRAVLAVGAAPDITLVVTAPAIAGIITNGASVAATTNDPIVGNNSVTQSTTVIPNGNLTGHVYSDDNGNGIQDAGEGDISGATVTITTSTLGTVVTTTDAAGNYAATVPSGLTTIDITDPAGYTLTTGNDPQVVNVVAGGSSATPVGYQALAANGLLRGHVYSDDNGSGIQEVWEVDFSGAQVTITTSTGGTVVTTTDAAGNYAVLVPTGDTIATVTDPVGYILTTGNNPQTVTVAAGLNNTTPVGYQPLTVSADLSISKIDNPDPVVAGGVLTYTIGVSNNGPNAASGITVTDTLPAGVIFVSGAGAGWSCIEAAGTVTCSRGGLGLGAGPDITIIVNAPAAGGNISNTAIVTSATSDPNNANNSATQGTTVIDSADLSITKSDSPDPVTAGQNITYTLSVVNAGPSDAANLSVTDTLPAGVIFVSVAGTGWTCGEAAGVVTCTVATLAVGAAPDIAIVVTAPANGGLITNTASMTSTTPDPVPGNDSATEGTTVNPSADLSITKTDSVVSVNAGGSTTYTIVVTNNGPSDVTGGTVADTMPAEIAAFNWTCSASAGSGCTASGSGSINDSVSLLSGGTATYTVTATISGSATGPIANTATAAVPVGTIDPVPGNNSATDTDTVNLIADLSIVKTDGVVSVTAGGNTTYTIVVTNNGPSDVTGATVSDALPAEITAFNWTCSASAGSGCTASGSGSINDSVSLLSGGTATYTVTATISGSAIGPIVNTATAAVPVGTTDPVPGNNSAADTDTVTLIAGADLSITKTDGVVSVDAGGSTTYTIIIVNSGPNNVTGATVADTMPAGITAFNWTCAASAGSGCGSASGSGAINQTVDLLSGGTATYTVTATINGSATGNIVNTATVTGPAGVTDPVPANNTASDTDTISQPDLTITKTHSGNFSQGQIGAQYSITVTNQAGSGIVSTTGTTVTVADTLPAGLTPVAASGVNWSCGIAAQTVTCIRSAANNALSAAASYPVITVTVNVAANAAALLTNTVSVSLAGQVESNTGNNSAADPTNIDQPNVFDPPAGFKTVTDSGYPELVWRMVWINSGNAVALLTNVADDIDSNVSYVPASLQCEARGTSVTAVCVYDSVARRITWQGNIGPDPGATNEVQALNEVVITFRTTVAPNIARVENRGCANWDTNGNGILDEIGQQSPVCSDDPATAPSGDPTVWAKDQTVAIPTLDEWGMIIFMILAGVMSLFYMRKRSAGSRS